MTFSVHRHFHLIFIIKSASTSAQYLIEYLTPNQKVPGSTMARAGIVLIGYGCTTHVVVLRLSDGTLNRGPVCVRMHLRICADLKEPGWPSKSLGVQYIQIWHTHKTQRKCKRKQVLAKVIKMEPLLSFKCFTSIFFIILIWLASFCLGTAIMHKKMGKSQASFFHLFTKENQNEQKYLKC